MIKKAFFSAILALSISGVYAQKYFTKSGIVQFDASGPLEKIQSKNGSTAIVLNTATGELQSSVMIKSFVFDQALMQEHFNENYMESDKHPKATFKGKISNNSAINYAKDGTYQATVAGTLTMHGVTKNVTTTATVTVKGSSISVSSSFTVLCSDYGISIPGAVKGKLSNQVKISIKGNLEKM